MEDKGKNVCDHFDWFTGGINPITHYRQLVILCFMFYPSQHFHQIPTASTIKLFSIKLRTLLATQAVFRAAPPVGAALLQHLNADVASLCADRGRRATVTPPMWPVTTGFYTGQRGSQDARGSCKSVNALLTVCTDVRERLGYMNSHLFPSGLGRLPQRAQKKPIVTRNIAVTDSHPLW